MLCGVSRLSPRSLIATGIFFTVALITANTGVGMPFPTCAGSKPCYLPVYPTNTEVMFMSSAILVGRFINSVLVPRFLPGTKHAATIYSFIAGLEFGLGLLISGLANPAKVLGFFSWFNLETFDPSLAVVIAFALVPLLASYSEMKKEHGNEEGKKPIGALLRDPLLLASLGVCLACVPALAC
jgi:preprotein translocase subunit Sec61beta